jgi:GT2 family glycosyltransferase
VIPDIGGQVARRATSYAPAPAPQPDALWVGYVELADGLDVRAVEPEPLACGRARLLVRLHNEPLGFVTVPTDPTDGSAVPAGMVEAAIYRELAPELERHLREDGTAMPVVLPEKGFGSWDECAHAVASAWQEPMTVAVCTRDRPELLSVCIDSLRELEYPALEILIVDNASSDDRTRLVVERVRRRDPRFRYVSQPVPGLSAARNVALVEAKHDYIAFTDDDVIVDPSWLEGIARGFGRAPGVGCVTGLVAPARLYSASQRYFDQRYTWSASMAPRLYDMTEHRGDNALYPYSPGVFGTGANFAVDRRLVVELGGFDLALGGGSYAGGGEDLDIFVRILQAGSAIAYEPGSVVWHKHRESDDELRDQLLGYGRGLAAFITKHLLDPGVRIEVLRRVPGGLRRLFTIWARTEATSRTATPSKIDATRSAYFRLELLGMAAGPYAYWRGRRSARRRAAGLVE